MELVGDYHNDGYAHVRGLIPKDVAHAFMALMKQATGGQSLPVNEAHEYPAVLRRPAFDIASRDLKALQLFLWGLTPIVGQLVRRKVLPSYSYFRIYRERDVCLVHSDRPASQHGLSLTLDYSDGEIWELQVGKRRTETLYPLSSDFGSDEYASIGMEVGDAVLYQASHYPHGRMFPNPNGWSAHLFLFFVDQDGPYSNHAFDGEKVSEKVNFDFV